MSIDKQTVVKVARLARIRLDEKEQEHFTRELNGILKFVEQLQEVNTDGVPELNSVSNVTLPRRKDVVTDGHIREDVLKNAPASEHGCFVVPKVIAQ